MTNIETTVARHDEKIKDLEKRAGERRQGEQRIFTKLDKIDGDIGELKTDFAGWKGRAAVIGTILMILISALVTWAARSLAA